MKTLSRWISRFCYNHPNFGIPNLMLYIAVGNVAIGLIDNFSAYSLSSALFFFPSCHPPWRNLAADLLYFCAHHR